VGSDSTGDAWTRAAKIVHEYMTSTGDSQWGWGEHCWHDWKEFPLFTSVEVRCSKCGKLLEDYLEAEDAHKG
jgi:hypothetical protein